MIGNLQIAFRDCVEALAIGKGEGDLHIVEIDRR
jgi:hypothetical protein